MSGRRGGVFGATAAAVCDRPPLLYCCCPTAVQALAEVHHTPFSELPWDPAGPGVDCCVQVDPFHTSARVCEPTLPTASQEVALTQDTCSSCWSRGPDWLCGLGVFWTRQALPFHASVSAFGSLDAIRTKNSPAASQELAEAQESAVRKGAVLFAGS